MRQAAAEVVTEFAEKAGLPGDTVSRDLVPPLKALASDNNSQVWTMMRWSLCVLARRHV